MLQRVQIPALSQAGVQGKITIPAPQTGDGSVEPGTTGYSWAPSGSFSWQPPLLQASFQPPHFPAGAEPGASSMGSPTF